ncbi:MAG: hypothetical protein ACJ708_01455 [Nitrososphaeraceae archaeon]|jgi:hypothetical protein
MVLPNIIYANIDVDGNSIMHLHTSNQSSETFQFRTFLVVVPDVAKDLMKREVF